ncbi:hypothetical protein [Variovorax sp. RA8]|uniref:hypothetical protein n=1 Tax=Variovorax sp. (strain JCM 16519 / RA8) TaxID=662548 RepID=UPI0013A59BC1|nr:hypothetical protein [Variovorax sp. RA8]
MAPNSTRIAFFNSSFGFSSIEARHAVDSDVAVRADLVGGGRGADVDVAAA